MGVKGPYRAQADLSGMSTSEIIKKRMVASCGGAHLAGMSTAETIKKRMVASCGGAHLWSLSVRSAWAGVGGDVY